MGLNLHNNFILLYCAFPDNFPHWLSPANIFFFLWLEMVFKAMGLDVSGSYLISLGLFHVYRRHTCYKTFVCFSTVYLSHVNLILRPAKRILKSRENFFSFWHRHKIWNNSEGALHVRKVMYCFRMEKIQ